MPCTWFVFDVHFHQLAWICEFTPASPAYRLWIHVDMSWLAVRNTNPKLHVRIMCLRFWSIFTRYFVLPSREVILPVTLQFYSPYSHCSFFRPHFTFRSCLSHFLHLFLSVLSLFNFLVIESRPSFRTRSAVYPRRRVRILHSSW
jgi:hypothetical protein